MPTLKTTISLESTDLLTAALKNTKTVTETINGAASSFEQNRLAANSTEVLFESTESAGNAGVLYFYCEASSTNSSYGITLTIDNNSAGTAAFAKLLPGDVIYMPVYAGDANGITVYATNTDPVAEATINYFFGSKN